MYNFDTIKNVFGPPFNPGPMLTSVDVYGNWKLEFDFRPRDNLTCIFFILLKILCLGCSF